MASPNLTATGRSQNLGSLAALVVLLVIATGFAGLFSLHMSQKRFSASLDSIALAEQTMDNARQAQVAFKIQVQEWKNILIRGYKAEDMPDLRTRFETREQSVREALARMQQALPNLKLPSGSERALTDTAEVLRMHIELGKEYREALTLWKPEDPLGFRLVDAKVRGKDRPIDAAIDRLTAYLGSEVVLMHTAYVKQGEENYSFLHYVVFAISGLTLCLTIFFVYSALKRDEKPKELPPKTARR